MPQDPRYGPGWQDQPPYQQQGYGPAYGSPYSSDGPRGTNAMAILALVFAFVFFPLGIVLGHIARRQIRQSGEEGNGLAVAGLVISYLQLALILLGIAILAIVVIVVVAVGTAAA